MVEQVLCAVGITADCFSRARKRLLVSGQGASRVTSSLGDFAHQGQGLGSLGEGFVGQISFVLVLEIRQRPVANRIERVQPSDRLQLLFQITEHESDQALGLPSLVAGFIACLKRRDRKACW